MATTARRMPATSVIMVNIFDGTRQLIGPEVKNLLVRVIDGNQNQVSDNLYSTPSLRFDVPFFDNFGDNYTVIASADSYLQAGFTPVTASPAAVQAADIMLVPKDSQFNFSGANWPKLQETQPAISALLAHGAADGLAAQNRYEALLEEKPASLACLFNLMTAMAEIHLPVGTPLDYFKELIWEDMPAQNLFAPAQDRCYAWVNGALAGQVKTAVQQGEFAAETSLDLSLHPGATSSYKQIQFGEANVQLTFHEDNTRTIDGVECVAIEPDIDYYKDIGAHALLEAFPNILTSRLTDPKVVYVLRWIAGRHAGVADFDPPYTLVP